MTVSIKLSREAAIMLKWAGAAAIAKILFIVFVILCVVFLVLGFVVTKKIVD
jgi:hypothetical protein